MDILGDSTLTTLQAPAAVTTTAASAGVDARTLTGQGALILTSLNTAGTTPTLAVKLQGSADSDVVTSVTPGSNTGNGTCTQVYGGPDAVAEDITITFSNSTTASVVGSESGALGTATVGTLFSCAQIEFLLTAGGTNWALNDTIVIVTTARTYADVPGGAFTGLTTSTSVQKKAINFDALPRYLRVHRTIGGTNSPGYTIAVVAQSMTV